MTHVSEKANNMERIEGQTGAETGKASEIISLTENFAPNMPENEISNFFNKLALKNCPNNTLGDWARAGACQAADCAIFLQLLALRHREFEPSLHKIHALIDKPFDASRLYTLFLENYYDETDERQRNFVAAVNANPFHVLKKLDRDGRDTELKPFKGYESYMEQVTWATKIIKKGLRALLEEPDMDRKISAQPPLFAMFDTLLEKIGK